MIFGVISFIRLSGSYPFAADLFSETGWDDPMKKKRACLLLVPLALCLAGCATTRANTAPATLAEGLRRYPGAVLLISHDRDFLNELVGSVVEIRQSRLIRYRGNYDDFLGQREAQATQWLAAYKNQQQRVQEMERFVARNISSAGN